MLDAQTSCHAIQPTVWLAPASATTHTTRTPAETRSPCWPGPFQERLAAALELLGEKAELLEEAMTDMDEMRVSEEKREGDVAGWEGRREG